MGINRSGYLKRLAATGALAAITGLVSTPGVLADETAPGAAAPAATPAKAKKPMKMDQPMPGEMKKEGMRKGDVSKAAAKKQRDMKDVMEKEEKAMAQESTKGLK